MKLYETACRLGFKKTHYFSSTGYLAICNTGYLVFCSVLCIPSAKTRPGHRWDYETPWSSWPHSAALGWVLLACHFSSPSLSGLPDMWKFHSRNLDRCRYREALITHSKWLQTVISTALGAGKGLLFLDLSQRNISSCYNASLCKEAEGSGISVVPMQTVSSSPWFKSLLMTPLGPVLPSNTHVVMYFKTTCILSICKYTYFAFMRVTQVSHSQVPTRSVALLVHMHVFCILRNYINKMHVPRFFRKESKLCNSWKTTQKLWYMPINYCYTQWSCVPPSAGSGSRQDALCWHPGNPPACLEVLREVSWVSFCMLLVWFANDII